MNSLTTARPLLDALEARGPHPVLAWYGEEARIELSGQVLAGWLIKAIGHLDMEIALAPGDAVLLDMAPHWKRTVLATACWALGADLILADRAAPTPSADDEERASSPAAPSGSAPLPRVVITDRPQQAPLDAEELLAVQPVSLAMRFDGDLPPLAHDWVQEVRSAPDRLAVALPSWSGPQPGPAPDVLGLDGDGLEDTPTLLGTLLGTGRLVGPREALDARTATDEGLA